METTKDTRLQFGFEAEDFCRKHFDRLKIKVMRTRDRADWDPYLDRRIGDLIIEDYKFVFIDVKRGGISEDSLNHFKGQYYFVYNGNLTELFIFKPEDIKNNSAISKERLSSGDWGIKHYMLIKHVPYMELDEFIAKLHSRTLV
jgi:hypothetical protein